MIIDDFSNPKRKLTVSEASAANDYFTRRKSEEDRIAGIKAPAKNKKNPANTDYAKKRKQQDVEESRPFRGTGGAFNRGDDERHDLDPSDWYIVKDGKMFAASIYPRQVQQAIAQGFSRTKQEARAKASSEGVAEMDSSGPKGRMKSDGTRSHSTYGSRDHYSDADPQSTAKPVTVKDFVKNATKILTKHSSKTKGVADDGRKQQFRGTGNAGMPRTDDDGNVLEQGVSEGESTTQKYEMMMRNGQVKKFIAKDDADAKRIAAGHGAKSVIKLKGGVPAGKIAEQGVAEGTSTTWEVSYDYGPHMTKSVTVKARSEEEAAAKVEKDAQRRGFSIMINSVTPAEQGVAEGEYDSRKPFGVRYKVFAGREGRMATREYWTTSEEKLQKAVDKIQALDNFYEIDGYSYPKESQGVTEVFADQGSGSSDRDNAEYMKRRKAAGGLPGGFSKSDYMPGATKKHVNTNCTTCHGRKGMYKLDGKLFADNKVGAVRVKCPTCHGTGDKQSLKENAEDLHIGDPVIITGNGIKFEGATGEIVDFGRDNRFVVVNLYNHGRHSFHSSDVSFNEYAGSDDEEARMYDAGEFGDDHRDDMDEARMSAAQRLSNAWDKQRAKSDASLRRTPSSIPKTVDKERMIRDIATSDASPEHKKVAIDAVMKTMSESRVQRQQLLAKMLNSH